MPKGKRYQPYRLPGAYTCCMCRDLKDAEDFYKDSSRFNGCSSRCKDCCNKRREEKRRLTRFEVKKLRKEREHVRRDANRCH